MIQQTSNQFNIFVLLFSNLSLTMVLYEGTTSEESACLNY